METSLFLAKSIGLFGTIATAVIILRYKFHVDMETRISANSESVYQSGYLFLLLGVMIVVSHQVWKLNWQVLITIIGWMLLFKGLMRILFPYSVRKMITKKKQNSNFLLAEISVFLISIFLLLKGFLIV